MSLKAAIRVYFEAYFAAYDRLGRAPRTEWLDAIDPRLFVGSVDNDGYVAWRPMEKSELTDLRPLESIYKAAMHHSVVEYFNSFWHLDIGGAIDARRIELLPVVPGEELREVLQYAAMFTANGTGAILLVDPDRDSCEIMAPSLESLVLRLAASLAHSTNLPSIR